MAKFLIYTGAGIIIGGCVAFVLAFIILAGKEDSN